VVGYILACIFFSRISATNSELIRRPAIGLSVSAGFLHEGLDKLVDDEDESVVLSEPVLVLIAELKVLLTVILRITLQGIMKDHPKNCVIHKDIKSPFETPDAYAKGSKKFISKIQALTEDQLTKLEDLASDSYTAFQVQIDKVLFFYLKGFF
jgi:hypothetical protein